MIDFGNDFFKWFSFMVRALKLFISIFGTKDEKDAVKNNHIDG